MDPLLHKGNQHCYKISVCAPIQRKCAEETCSWTNIGIAVHFQNVGHSFLIYTHIYARVIAALKEFIGSQGGCRNTLPQLRTELREEWFCSHIKNGTIV